MKSINKQYIEELEKPFVEQSFDNKESFIVHRGSIPVLVSAPHSVPQLRNGKIKLGEYRSGVIAKLLHKELNCYTIYKTRNDQDDANYDETCVYKDAVIELIRQNEINYLLDIHIMSPERDYFIDIGTGRGANIKQDYSIIQEMVTIFKRNEISQVEIDKVFTASYPYTVSSTVSRECNIMAIQLEVNWKLLDTKVGIENFRNTIKSLIHIITFLRGD